MADQYVGRFAPSPTGPLHFGSLVAAMASYLDARSRNGNWLVRIDDLDPPREVEGAARAILEDLQSLGMKWDGDIVYQSQRLDVYRDALCEMMASGAAFECGCTRKNLPKSGIYPGTCANGLPDGKPSRSIRIHTHRALIHWHDEIQGWQTDDLAASVGPFVIRRADGLTAYQLAVVVDDAASGITHIVRGADLASSTPRQIHLQRVLGLPTPTYAHVPVALNELGRKLSKSTGAAPIDTQHAVVLLSDTWRFLTGVNEDPRDAADVDTWWTWAINEWSIASVPSVYGLRAV